MTEKDFRILEDYVLPPKAPPFTEDFYKYIKPTREEVFAKLEYDMDEEDFAWLELFNEQRSKTNLSPISFDSFECLVDLFEKECFFHCTSKNFKPVPPELEHQADCAVCLDGTSNEDNAILFCDMCSLSVHQKCYGVVKVPDEIWLCKRCLHSPASIANCYLCPSKSGALKRSLDGKWMHVVCAFWIPEVNFGSDRAREPIMGIENIPSIRWKLTCFVCSQKGKGACLQCQHSNCSTAYHASCAQLVGLTMKLETFIDTDGISKKKVTTFCEVHSTHSVDDNSTNNELREYEGPKYLSSDDSEEDAPQKNEKTSSVAQQDSNKNKKHISWKSRLKLARKILAAWVEMEQPIFVPVVTVATINKIMKKARELEIEKHESFITRLHSYWTLKRQSRDGYPLLNSRKFGENIKILNVNVHLSPESFHPQSKSLNLMSGASVLPPSTNQIVSNMGPIEREGNKPRRNNSSLNLNDDDDDDGDDDIGDENDVVHLMSCQRLRQDLEKVRLLIELVRKRERLKIEQIKLYEKHLNTRLCPVYSTVRLILDEIKQIMEYLFKSFKDGNKYLETLETKLEDRIYFALEDFLSDLKIFFALCPPALVKKINEKINDILHLTISKGSVDGPTHHLQADDSESNRIIGVDDKSAVKFALKISSSLMECDIKPNKSRGKKRKCVHDIPAMPQSASKLLLTSSSPRIISSIKKYPSVSNYYQVKKQKQILMKNEKRRCSGSIGSLEKIPGEKESFKTYRMTNSPKVDDENWCEKKGFLESIKSGSSSGGCEDGVKEMNEGEEDDDEDCVDGAIPEFKPFDLVWAKFHGCLWYPAIVLIPDGDPPSYLNLQLPTLTQETLDNLAADPLLKLVLFFEEKPSWKCIPVSKLLPLGKNPAIDKWKLLENKKVSIRKEVQTAYDKALQYHQSEISKEKCFKSSKMEYNSIRKSIKDHYQIDLLQLQHQLSQQIISESNESSIFTNRSSSQYKHNVITSSMESPSPKFEKNNRIDY